MIDHTPTDRGLQRLPDFTQFAKGLAYSVADQTSHTTHVMALKILGPLKEKNSVDKENSGKKRDLQARSQPISSGAIVPLQEKSSISVNDNADAESIHALCELGKELKMHPKSDEKFAQSAADEIAKDADAPNISHRYRKSQFVKRILNYANHGIADPTADKLALKRLQEKAQGNCTPLERQIRLSKAIDYQVRLWGLQNLVRADQSGDINVPLVMKLVMQDHSFFQKHSEILSQNRDISLQAVKIDAQNFQFVSPSLQNDLEFALLAIQLQPEAFAFASDELKKDFDFCMSAVMKRPSNLQFIGTGLSHYDPIALACCSVDGRNLEFVDAQCKKYKKLVLAMMEKDGRFLKSVSAELRNDEEVVLTAIKNHAGTFSMAGDAIREKREVALAAIKRWGSNLKYAGHELQSDRAFVKIAVKNDFSALRFANKKMRDDWTFLPLLRLSHYFRSTKLFHFLRMISLFRI